MLKKETVISDLKDICAQTNANWLCALDIYTANIKEDEAKFLPPYIETGLKKKYILLRTEATLEYGGGLRFNYHKLYTGGYTFLPPSDRKPLVLIPGFDLPVDQAAVYHECAHLYQYRHNFFSAEQIPNESYQKYLKEVHANAFANMALLLRADNVLSFKKQRLSCFAQEVQCFNEEEQSSKFYFSLPVTLELLRTIRREGRLSTLKKFSKNGKLDFQKLAFYTADFVRQHAYSESEFEKILENKHFYSYDLLKQKAKAWHRLSDKYINMQQDEMSKRIQHYFDIEDKRKIETDRKIKKLPETDKRAKIINAVCEMDILHTRLSQYFCIYANLDDLMSNKILEKYGSIFKLKDQKEIADISAKVKKLYQTWQQSSFFRKLYNKINDPETRDEVWALKFKKEKQLNSKHQILKFFER